MGLKRKRAAGGARGRSGPCPRCRALASPSLRRAGALVAVAAAAMIASTATASSAAAGKPARSRTTTVNTVVHRHGEYAVVVSLPRVNAPQTVTVAVGAERQAGVALSTSAPVSLAFDVHVGGRTFATRATTIGPPIHFTVASSPLSAADPAGPTGSTGVSGATGTTGATGATGPVSPTVLTAPATAAYSNLVWSDEFSGPAGAQPSPSIWTYDNGGGCGPGTLSTNTQSLENASLDGEGDLAINAIAGPDGYTSAQLDTAGAFAFQYGRIEARIEQPAGAGLCSAFWLLGGATETNCWPGCGEIDVMEAIGNRPDQANAFLHGPVTGSANNQQWGMPVTAASSLTTSFHTYGLIWRPNSLTWTIDGVPYAHATPASLPRSAQWVFNGHPFHILLDLAVGGWPGPPNAATAFPATMRVAWVRVYQ